MGRILAIDFGTKRTGLAVTDPLRIIASALDTVPTDSAVAYVAEYVAREGVELIVVGEPLTERGLPSESQRALRPFLDKLRAALPEGFPVELWDERYTSKMAQQVILESGIGRQARRDKALADRVAATIILRSWLDSVRNR